MTHRITGIDLARAIAILLVTWKHSMASFGARAHLDGWVGIGLEILMQLATPTFLILFGAMLELVYRTRFERGLAADTTKRLHKRALHCYAYYGLAIIVFFSLKGTYSAPSLPLVFTGFISVPYSHLLAFYTVALAFAPFLIIARLRYGLWPLIGVALLVQFAHPLLSQLPPAPEVFGRDYLQHMSGFVYGKGVDFIGPSLIHGMSLVCFGMLFGHGLKPSSSEHGASVISLKTSLWMAAITIIVIAAYWEWHDPMIKVHALVDATLRMNSHPLYFSIGILGAMSLTWLCILLYDRLALKTGLILRVFGRRSLFAFGVGNILAYMAPSSMVTHFGLRSSVVILFGTVCLLTALYDQYELRRAFLRLPRFRASNAS